MASPLSVQALLDRAAAVLDAAPRSTLGPEQAVLLSDAYKRLAEVTSIHSR